MAKQVYPLKQVIEVKQRRVEDAEKVVKEKLSVLEKEQQKLAEKKAERDKAKKHKDEKLQQLRDEMDSESSSPKIQQMKVYLKIVDEKLKVEEKKVQDQKELVNTAEQQLEAAKVDLKKKRQEVDKILLHQKDWEKEIKKEEQLIESRDQDELGSIIHGTQHLRQ